LTITPHEFIEKEGAASVSEQSPSQEIKSAGNTRTILFMILLSFSCALILSIMASILQKPKEAAKDLDRIKQLLIAAKILNNEGVLLIRNPEGLYVSAKFSTEGALIPSASNTLATNSQIMKLYQQQVVPMLVDDTGKLLTFQEAGVNESEYLIRYKKTGYYRQPFKLVYKILQNPGMGKSGKENSKSAEGYVIPVNGFGLWDAIYGYLAIYPDGNRVIGITWYDQKETPGLGANIADAPWQSLFPGKQIFQESSNGKIDFKTAPVGIVVVKGKVAEVLGDSPKAKSAVDGMAGATLTGNGVTDAYKNVLNAYRPFLIKLHQESKAL
jgi:Na+-transporting NADH:ubiquinone oxidoreductase subunit C